MPAPTPAYARTGTRSPALRAPQPCDPLRWCAPGTPAPAPAEQPRCGATRPGGTATGGACPSVAMGPCRPGTFRAAPSRGEPPRWVGVTAVPLRIAPRARHRGAAACAVADLLRPGGPADAARTACERAVDTRPGRSGGPTTPSRPPQAPHGPKDRRAPGRPTAPQPPAPRNTDRTTATPSPHTPHRPATPPRPQPPAPRWASSVPRGCRPAARPVGALARGRTTGRSSRRLPSGPARAWDSVRRQPRSTAPVRSVARATAASRAADASSTVSVRSSARKRSA